MAKTKVITSENVKLHYGDFEALHGINLDFAEHEITALIGPSGCGKSTYLRCLNRMNDLIPTARVEGDIRLRGQDIYAPSQDVVQLRKSVGMVFQQPNPFPFSIYENVVYGLRLAGVKDRAVLDEAVETSLQQAAIWDEVKDKLHESALSLSGGQQQRVVIGRVLAVKPEVILMDEPTSALDPISSSQIENMLLALRHDYTIILVTHNMHQASRISDKTAFFLQGRLVEAAPTKQIFFESSGKRNRRLHYRPVRLGRRRNPMRRLFSDELNDLHVRFSEMGMMANEAIFKSVRAFVNHDKDAARAVIADDKHINKREVDLENRSFELIALQQPVTTDLRIIVTVMKASSDLERMGDHAVSIAKSTIRVKGETRVPEIERKSPTWPAPSSKWSMRCSTPTCSPMPCAPGKLPKKTTASTSFPTTFTTCASTACGPTPTPSSGRWITCWSRPIWNASAIT